MISEKLYIEYKIIHSLGELAKILIGEYVYTQWGEIKTLRTTPDGVSRHHNPLVVQGKTRKIVMVTGTPVPVRHFLIPPTATGDYNTPTPYGDGNPYGSRDGARFQGVPQGGWVLFLLNKEINNNTYSSRKKDFPRIVVAPVFSNLFRACFLT